MKLNARQVETAKPKEKSYKLTDGGGLYLEISARGAKYWRMENSFESMARAWHKNKADRWSLFVGKIKHRLRALKNSRRRG